MHAIRIKTMRNKKNVLNTKQIDRDKAERKKKIDFFFYITAFSLLDFYILYIYMFHLIVMSYFSFFFKCQSILIEHAHPTATIRL